ncbi:MAG: DUF3419 family protein [Bradymonadaceae bacterium]
MGLKRQTDDETIDERTSFDFIRYANCWEDAEVLTDALNVGPGDRVLSVASAGDNALALLATGAEVVAADISPAQLACLDLRRVAFRRLSYGELLVFLGLRPSCNRLGTYRRLRDDLTAPARRFWDAREDAVADGIVHAGKFEQYFKVFREEILPLMHPQWRVDRLLEPKSKGRRYDFYHRHWNNWRWRTLFRIFFSRHVMGWLGRDPEFFRHVDGSVAAEMLRRTRRAFTELPTHDNPYLEYILTGTFRHTLPPYLARDCYEAICENLDALTLVEGPVQQAAREAGGEFDAFNLSDVFEYVDASTAVSIFEELLESASVGARMAYWNMMVPRRCADFHPEAVESQTGRARELASRDRAFFYGDFHLEVVQ